MITFAGCQIGGCSSDTVGYIVIGVILLVVIIGIIFFLINKLKVGKK